MYRQVATVLLPIVLLLGCQPDWTAVVDRDPATTRRESVPITAYDPADVSEIPEQDVRADWVTRKVIRVSDGDTVVLLIDEEDIQIQRQNSGDVP